MRTKITGANVAQKYKKRQYFLEKYSKIFDNANIIKQPNICESEYS